MKKLKIPANLTVLAYESIKQYILEGRLDGDARNRSAQRRCA